jgi:ribosome-associated protein
MIQITDRVFLAEREIQERFVRSIGARSQNLEKDATAVELRLDLRKSALPSELKERLVALSRRHVTTNGILVVASRASRSQMENREAAHRRLVGLLKRAAAPPKPRKPTKPDAGRREQRLTLKRRRSATKRLRAGRDHI